MTTAVDESSAPVPTQDEKAPLKFKNEGHKMQFDMLAELISKRNEVVKKLNAASGDKDSIRQDIFENSTDPEIVQLRDAIAEAQERLNSLIDPLVEERITNASGSTEELENALKEIDSAVKPGVTFFKKLYDDGSFEHLPSQERIKGARSVSSASGGRRIRGFNVVVTIDGESTEHENFTNAAKHLDVETSELQAAFFEKAGTKELKEVPNVVNMVIDFDETDSEGVTTKKQAVVKAYRTDVSETASPSNEGTEPEPAEVTPEPAAENVNLEEL